MAQKHLTNITELTGKGKRWHDWLDDIESNFNELYLGQAAFTPGNAVADATDEADAVVQLNALLAELRILGIIDT